MDQRAIIYFLVIACGAFALRADTNTINLEPSADATLAEYPETPAGGGSSVVVAGSLGLSATNARCRALFRFSLPASIPTNATITSVSLTLNVIKSPLDGVASTFSLHRQLVDWNEAQASWAFADTARAWSFPGGQVGVDWAAESQATMEMDVEGPYSFASNTNLVATVQDWLLHPENNFGWLLKTDSEDMGKTARRIGARENPNPVYRPILAVNYSTSPTATAPKLVHLTLTHSVVAFQFNGEAGISYRIEGTDVLRPPVWSPVTNTPPLPTAGVVNISEPVSTPSRFYRVLTP
jgi:hypothetical protein